MVKKLNIREHFLQFTQDENIPVVQIDRDMDVPSDLHIVIIGEHGKWDGIAVPFEEEKLFVFYVNMGLIVPDGKREKIADWMMKKNFLYQYGGLYMDTQTGTAITRCSMLIYGSDEDKQELIRKVVYTSAVIADQTYEELRDLLAV